MKVLQVVKTSRGATWALNQAAYLKKQGVEVITVLPDENEGKAARYKELGMKVIKGDWSLPVAKPWTFFKKCKEIRTVIAETAPDLIHLHFVTNVLMCRLALRENKIPRLFQVPGPLHLENALTSFVERHTATAVDYWAGACRKTCDIYKSKGIDDSRVYLAYYGVPQEPLVYSGDHNILHKEFNIPQDKTIVAMVSYFYKPKKLLGQKRGLKGHEDFIDAMKIVLSKYDNVVPVVIGNAWDGSDEYEQLVKRYAREQLGNRMIFTGYRGDVYQLYPEIDVAVHPSHSENLGGAAESLMMAVPTISSNVGGFADIVIPGKTGCLVEPRNPADLAQKIEWAICHPDEMRKMAENGQQLVRKLLALDKTSKVIYDIYRRILK